MTNPIIVSSGQFVSGITIDTGEMAYVENGGTLEASTLDILATVTVSAGGVISGIDVAGGTIQNAGTAIATVLMSAAVPNYSFNRGTQSDMSGSVASDTLLLAGGTEVVDTHALSLDATVSAGGGQYIEGGIASATIVLAQGTQETNGGRASDTEVTSGGLQWVEGGDAIGTQVDNGGFMYLQFGDVRGAMIASGGEVLDTDTYSAGKFAGVIANGGTLAVALESAPHSADLQGTDVQSGGTLVLLDGATETGAVIESGAAVISATAAVFTFISGPFVSKLDAATAGVLSGFSVGSLQDAVIYGGGHASATTVLSGGYLEVDAGGKAMGTVVGNGGREFDSGVARSTVLDSGGLNYVEGGTSVSPLIEGGRQILVDNGVASAALVLDGGVQIASGGGAAIDTRVARAGALSLAEGLSLNAVISALGVETTFYGQVDNTMVQSGGQLVVGAGYAVVSGGTIAAGGVLVLDAGNRIDFDQAFAGTVLASGATEVVLGSESETGLVVAPGARIDHESIAVFSGVNSNTDGTRLAQFGSALSGVTVGAYAGEVVFSGGVATATTVSGMQTIYSGGSASDTALVGSVASQVVLSGGSATSTTVARDTVQFNGGTVSGAVILRGGAQINEGGVALGTVLSGGEQFMSGGTAYDTVVANHGEQNEQAGMVHDTSVLSGGIVQLAGRGATGITIGSGGRVLVFHPAVASGTTISAGGVLQIAYGSAVNTVVQAGGSIDLTQFTYVSGGTAVVNASDLLTVTEGGRSYELQLAGNYAGEAFQLHADSKGGTLITLSAVQGALAGVARSGELLPGEAVQQRSGVASSAAPLPAGEHASVAEHAFDAIVHVWQQ